MAKGTCSAKGCDRPIKAHGWCDAHYGRWRDCGDIQEWKPLQKRRIKPRPVQKCLVADCAEAAYARGWCQKHYQRWYARPDRGDPAVNLRPEMEMSEKERFWAKVNRDGPVSEWCPDLGACWLWTASLDSHGRGHFRAAPGLVQAHRYSYLEIVGAITSGLELDHLCMVPPCVNPSHLEPVTRQENIRRRVEALWIKRNNRCIHGHEMTPANTISNKWHAKACRRCAYDAVARYQERQKAYS